MCTGECQKAAYTQRMSHLVISLLILPFFGAPCMSCRIVSVIGAALYLPGIFGLFQVILLYLSIGWPRYAASILAGKFTASPAESGRFPRCVGV